MIVGDKYESNAFGELKIIKVITPSTCKVKFEDTGGIAIYRNSDIRAGKVKDYAAATLYGVGRIMNYELAKKNPMSYKTWVQLMKRGYDKIWKLSNPTYKDVTVRKNWHYFPIFHRWYAKQLVEEGYILDKDIMSRKKEYSASNAFMIPYELNMYYSVNTVTKSDTELGVHKVGRKFVVRINSFNKTFPSEKSNSGSYVGTYPDTRTANKVYRYYRARVIVEMMLPYKGRVSPRLYNYVMKTNERVIKGGILSKYLVKQDPERTLL